MMTDYQDFIAIPYLVRKFNKKHQIKIFTTAIMYEMGRIYMKSFF